MSSYRVYIIERASGEGRWYELDDGILWGEGSVFWWTEGNMGCDCNREWDFARAGGMAEEEVAKIHGPCGRTRYFVPYAEVEGLGRVPLDKPEAQA